MINFTLKQLTYFVAAGEAGSILKAAETIHVSQPSISNAITHLEAVFQVQLFIRHHAQGMSLTTAGAQMLDKAKKLLRDADELRSFAGLLSDQIYGSINIGCFIPLAPIVTPELCHGFIKSHENVDINVSEDDQAELLNQLKRGSVDIVLTYNMQIDRDIHFIPLADLPPYILLASNHPMANEPAVDLKTLSEEPFILLDLPLSDSYFMSLFSEQQLKPKIYARTKHIEVQRGLVANGYGYSMANVRPLNQKSLDGHGLSYVPLTGKTPALTLGIAYLEGQKHTLVEEKFIQYCKEQISQDKIPGMATFQSDID